MKICVLLSRFPHPLDKGDKLRAYYFIKYLSQNHELCLIALDDTQRAENYLDEVKPFCKEVHILKLSSYESRINLIKTLSKGWPMQTAYFYDKKLHFQTEGIIEKFQPDVVFCQLLRMAPYVNNLKYKVAIDYMDAFSEIAKKNAQNTSFHKSIFWRVESFLMRRYERKIDLLFRNKIIISSKDKEVLSLNELQVVNNGVDTDYFSEKRVVKKFDLVFVGNLSYLPNMDCVEYIVNSIFPLILKERPHAKLLIAGKSPSKKIQNIQHPNIQVLADLPDIRDAYNQSSVLLAPIRIGAGMQNKLLEAMSMGLPCVTTSHAGNAISELNNKNMLIGDNPEEITNNVIALLSDEILFNNIKYNALEFVRENYSWKKSVTQLENILTNA